MKFILGTKQNMTQIFDDEGRVFPVTVISALPSTVVQVKNMDKDGYEAVQIGYGNKNPKKINKPIQGHVKGLGNFSTFREYKNGSTKHAVGDKIDLTIFNEGEAITVTGISKGKGFQGTVKRHGFAGGSRTHGQKHSEREPGAIGGGGGRAGGRVVKGMRMSGRMGGDRVSVKNLKIVKIDKENSTVYVKGAVPGRRGTLLEIRA
ncbi:MAG: 50S ribosomal protein L3 [Candidatus Taylorbacteria bacterium RIFCSPLOWO2_12_FULL_43_20]|uniref:Large ribosomal subunit protein uL3 n=1 Tax=Candidatus Taylorbacteria bacterium RIFCSPLOWO2_12_FULL_43_20 TaxID=1802332 RepID=A0A1G2P2B7_9BACT|nr:MAG: 50S ribosomal protein L3 [Candidatus Taylorbacteria bacterium RIFCSPHIGHO2_01_FULL_43_120]OHA23447.1 MAG: 50S ribosomal protein L3 [Candidatus Taylorbacteria bacterium RIFCSPHIGHO2_02_FULL_43_55]OHA29652.1 MAG: 50S ribosomal protein L3 [Candidatus Taylorbacteria bacterium RIFCSPHIGHO2_12_FULL_42_34]OHA31580.1 MAG: 50S ribosomal protein L3 [Candidatus Taylorbacteria bacterium RIFCSPLOWO2_01_FULL_43_83]OHA38961.1 MAG: 50S ribosomal protein L3 [Candidatus Taylorbacteria bacterium RIFCSPLOW